MNTTIEPIKAYSIQHLLLCLLLVASAAAIVFLLKKLKKTVVITVIGVVLALIEVFKQILIRQIYPSYSWSDVPFQLCSVPMYLCLAYPFAKKGRDTIENFLRSFGLMGAIVAFGVPCDVFSRYLFLSIQSIVWHEILLILGIYGIALAKDKKRLGVKAYIDNGLLYLLLALIAVGINALLINCSSGTANMFFLGPSRPYMLILNDIYEKCGWGIETIAMILASEAGGLVVLLVGELILRRTQKEHKELTS